MIKHKKFTVDFTNEEAKILRDAFDVLVDISRGNDMPNAIINLAEEASVCIDKLFVFVASGVEFEDKK